MSRKFYPMVLFLLCGYLYGEGWSVQTGLGYQFYTFHAREGATELDSRYNILGLDLGAVLPLSSSWEIRSSLFLGFPLSSAVYVGGELFSEPDLSLYDRYCYFLNFDGGPFYRIGWKSSSLSLGSIFSFDNLVLVSRYAEPGYLLSYTFGLGLAGHFEYYLKNWTLYADLRGKWNFLETLVHHSDFSYAWGAGLSLGLVWRF